LEAKGNATLRAITFIHRAPSPDLQALAPYAIAIAEAPDGLRLIGHAPGSCSIGDRVSISLKKFGNRLMPHFESFGAAKLKPE
jgi:uncharacterized OB-fold protein